MIFQLKKLVILLFFCLSSVASSEKVKPYQSCSEDRANYTDRVADVIENSSEAGFCFYCNHNNSDPYEQELKFMRSFNRGKKLIPSDCFLATALRGVNITPKSRSSYCSDPNFKNTSPTGIKKHCINKTYVDMISRSFSDMSSCFGFTDKEKENAFHVINHESGFILNARSYTRARCLGQLTLDYFKNINNIIKSKTHSDFHIFEDLIKRCPDLQDKVPINTSYFTCQTTHDPYICLFYTFFGLKQNMDNISDELNSNLGYRHSLSDEVVQKFKLPVNLNEMLVIKVNIKGEEKTWLAWDDQEVKAIIRNRSLDQFIEVQKIPLFKNEVNIINLTTRWSHNGGSAISRIIMPRIIKSLKQNISNGNLKEYRKKIMKGESLSVSELLPFLEAQIYSRYPSGKKRKKEVRDYISKTIKDSLEVFDESRESSYRNNYLSSMDRDSQDNFLRNIQNRCPKGDFSE